MKHLIKKLLQPRHLEYVEINDCLQIVEMSNCVKLFADAPDQIKLGNHICLGFPELFGVEKILQNVLKEKQECFELKGIARSDDPKNPLYIDLYAIASPDESASNRLLILVENATERMIIAQKLVHKSNETSLLYDCLKTAKKYLDRVISSMADALLITNQFGEIKSINQSTQELFKYQENELLGQEIFLLIPNQKIVPDLGKEKNINKKIFEDREFIGKTKDEQEITLSFSCSWLKHTAHDPPEFVYIGRDITARKQAEAALEYAKREAEFASQLKTNFLANISHELRTPMNAIFGMTELLLMTSLTEEQRDSAQTIHNSSKSLLELINELLDMSKIEAGQMKLQMIDFDLVSCLENVVDLLAPTAHQKNLEITLLISDSVPSQLQGDRNRLQQIFINLVSNAIKFTKEGEVCIKVYLEEETETTAVLYFMVHDTGIGMMPTDLDKIFQPFSQLDGSTTRQYGGTGLGLAICKQLVTIMGGKIGVNSQLNRGSDFWLTLPFIRQSYPQVPVKIASPLKDRHILVVDDNPNHRLMIRNHMRDWQVKITEAQSAEAAWQLLEKYAHNNFRQVYDLALIDVKIAEGNAKRLAQKIKENPAFSSIPLILMRSSQEREIAKEFMDIGFAGESIKPVKPSRLFEIMMRVVQCSSPIAFEPYKVKKTGLSSPKIKPQPLKILLAEDDIVNQKVARKLLENLGYDADVVANGQEVLERLEHMSYDVVLMDCQMPMLDGYQATQEIRRRWGGDLLDAKNTIHSPLVIAMTANASLEDEQKCFAAGMDDFIAKPVRLETLRAILSHWAQQLIEQ